MNTLRWILSAVIMLFGGGFLALFMFANGFRRSFGASENSPVLAILPLAAAGLLCAALVWPSNRILLHVGAIAAVGLVGLCGWLVIHESATVLIFAILYLVLWLVFYWLAAWAPATTAGIAS